MCGKFRTAPTIFFLSWNLSPSIESCGGKQGKTCGSMANQSSFLLFEIDSTPIWNTWASHTREKTPCNGSSSYSASPHPATTSKIPNRQKSRNRRWCHLSMDMVREREPDSIQTISREENEKRCFCCCCCCCCRESKSVQVQEEEISAIFAQGDP